MVVVEELVDVPYHVILVGWVESLGVDVCLLNVGAVGAEAHCAVEGVAGFVVEPLDDVVGQAWSCKPKLDEASDKRYDGEQVLECC